MPVHDIKDYLCSCNYVVMYRYRYISFLLFTCVAAACRAQLSAVVFDMETRRCVPGVTVYINPSGKTVTDKYGRFSVSDDCNSITLSHGSFEPLALDKASVHDTLWLLPKSRRLDEVVVYGIKPKPGFSVKGVVRSATAGVGNKGGSGANFDFFDTFNFRARRHAKRRKEIKEMLDKY